MGADIRYVAPDAQMSVLEIKWGLIPDMSITQTLPQLVRADVARELTFTGKIVSGTEAVELGLATRVCDDPLAAAMETARLIATKSPDAIRAGKKMFREMTELNRAQQLELETALQKNLLGSANQMEAVQANMQKRAPTFKDPD
jgi:enoyl-CoA hydratase/carnithine racemase